MSSELFHWDPQKFSVQVPQFDDAHRQLVTLMNALHALYTRKAPAREQSQALQALTEFTVTHFAEEEAYMRHIGYPGLAIHMGVHRNLLGRLELFAAAFAAEGRFGEELFVFLRMWLAAHICGVDARYGATAPENAA